MNKAHPVPPAKKRSSWLRRVAITSGALVLLLVLVYFVTTSSAFFKGVILPTVGADLNAEVTVSDAIIRPFSHVILRDLKVQTSGTEPLLTAKKIRLNHSLQQILGGNIKIAELVVESPTITVIQNSDGTSNLDPLLHSDEDLASDEKQSSPDTDSKTAQLDLGELILSDAAIQLVNKHREGGRDVIELTNVNVTLTNLKNGQTGQLKLNAEVKVDNQPLAPAAPGSVLAKFASQLTIALSDDLQSITLDGASHLAVAHAEGSLSQFASLACSLETALDLGQESVVLQNLSLTLTPTPRAPTNAITLTGQLAISKTNQLEGVLLLASETLDITSYYDLLETQQAKSASTGSTSPKRPDSPSAEEKEPPAVDLPVKLLKLRAEINNCYLREIALANVRATAKIEDNRLVLEPMQLELNGAAVHSSIDLNLGVPGYAYLMVFETQNLPLEPIVNSFSPIYRGRAKGDLLANVKLNGAGITGPSLQRNLSGDMDLSFTNANIQLVSKRARSVFMPIARALGIHDLLKSPIKELAARTKLGGGKVNLSQFEVVSEAFIASTKGDIILNSAPNSSPIRNWPVTFAVSRRLAEQANLISKNTPTNTAYVALPRFAEVGGTIGLPEVRTDKLALLQIGARAIGGLPGNIGDLGRGSAKALETIGGLLKANQSSDQNSKTNKPASAPTEQLFDLLKKREK